MERESISPNGEERQFLVEIILRLGQVKKFFLKKLLVEEFFDLTFVNVVSKLNEEYLSGDRWTI